MEQHTGPQWAHRPVAWRIVVTGRVQGVGYRAACEDQARALGLGGWVRNRHDGSVEVMAYGPPEQLAALREWMRRGPPAAQVSGLEVQAGEGEFDSFDFRPTA
ncbi:MULTISPECIES: acylphosphatase [unclassified Cupriavidus]|uniref:acylphosphatase n=1 Tax=unclassified Cupriavidus TaxID=2640874 RepID=UPI003F920DA1